MDTRWKSTRSRSRVRLRVTNLWRSGVVTVAVILAIHGCSEGRDARAWRDARSSNTIFAYEQILEKFPESRFAPEARALLEHKHEDLAWGRARSKNSEDSYTTYLAAYPDGRFAAESERRRIQAQLASQRAEAIRRARSDQDGEGFFQNLSAPKLAAGFNCPYGHEDVSWVPIRYGLYPAGAGGDLTQAVDAGCSVFPDSPTATLVCNRCKFVYHQEYTSTFWSRTSENPASFEGRLTTELLSFAETARSQLSLADDPSFDHIVADGETMSESVNVISSDSIGPILELSRHALRELCAEESSRQKTETAADQRVTFRCESARRHYEIEIRKWGDAQHRLRFTTRAVTRT